MFHIALFEPEIAGNAGNIARSCLAAGAQLHLIRPLGFRLSEEALRRAGMDYWHQAQVQVHDSFAAFATDFSQAFTQERVFAYSTKASTRYDHVRYQAGDVLLFGPESRGLPLELRQRCQGCRIPMQDNTRSLNLSVSVAVALYEAWRQQDFA